MSNLQTNYEEHPAEVPRPTDWQSALLTHREKQLTGESWYPRAQGSPETEIPRRFRAFQVDEGDFQASISPQKWDCTGNIAVPVNDGQHGNPVEITPFVPGRASLTVLNVDTTNSIIVSPTLEKALAGIGITVKAGGSFSMDCQAGVWAWAITGASTAQAMWTQYEAPTTHLPPKDKEG